MDTTIARPAQPGVTSADLIQLSAADRGILRDILDSDSQISLSIPEKIDPDQLWAALDTCGRVAGDIGRAADKIKPIIGRLLVVLQGYPDIYKSRGYHTYEDFMSRGMKELFNISRTEAYACRKVAEKFPSLTVNEFQKIGVAKLYQLSSMTAEGEKNYKPLMEKAKDPAVTRDDLRVMAEEMAFAERGEFELTRISITVPKTIAKHWKQFINDPMIQAFVGNGTDPANESLIFQRLMEECETEWRTQGKWIMDSGRHEAVVTHE